MIFTETKLKGAFIIDIERLEDERGFFGRSFCRNEFEAHGLKTDIVQANVSFNKRKGTLRGLHMQAAPFAESKLLRCTHGAIYDVIIDMRPDSPTFKEWVGIELAAKSYRMLYVPEGFAHGFLTLLDDTTVTYQVTNVHVAHAELGFRWDDEAFGIQWPAEPVIISGKDQSHKLYVPEMVL